MTTPTAIAFACMLVAAASPARAVCENVTGQVQAEVRRPRSAGSCNGETTLWLSNPTDTRVVCNYALEQANGNWDDGQTSVKAHDRKGGESGGMWTCDGTGQYKFACFSQPNWKKDWDCPLPHY